MKTVVAMLVAIFLLGCFLAYTAAHSYGRSHKCLLAKYVDGYGCR